MFTIVNPSCVYLTFIILFYKKRKKNKFCFVRKSWSQYMGTVRIFSGARLLTAIKDFEKWSFFKLTLVEP